MRFVVLVCVLFASFVWAIGPITVAPAVASTAVLDSSSIFENYSSPYADLEQIPSAQFQNVVIRSNFALKNSLDSSLPQKTRDFAKASYYYYKEMWDSAYAAYNELKNVDTSLMGDVILRMARSKFHMGDYKGMYKTLKQAKHLEKDESWKRKSARLRIEAAMADSKLSDRAHSDSLKVFLSKYPKSPDAEALKYRYARYQEKFKHPKVAKQYYMKLLTSKTSYKDSAYAALSRLRKVRGVPETLTEKVAYAKMACAKDEAEVCLSLLDSISIIDARLVEKNPDLIVAPTDDSLLLVLPPSTLDRDTRIALWEKRAVILRTLKRDRESIEQFRYLLDSVEVRPVWIQSTLRLLRKNAKQNADEIRMMDSLLHDANEFSKENANNLWVRGLEFEQTKKYDSALVCYGQLTHKRYGKNQKRQWAKFRMGFIYFKQEMWNEAVKAFIEASQEPFLWSGSAARMFLGDAYMKLGEDSLARAAYLDCIRDFPLAYYAHRSRIKLEEYKLMLPSNIPFAHGISMSEEETLEWIRSSQKNVRADTSYNQERYKRIKKLFLYGFAEDAFSVYDEARKKNYKRLDFLYEYGSLFYEMGEIAAGYRLARQFQNNIDRRRLMAPPIRVLHFLYPVPFKEQVGYHSGERIDPFFVYSVMRQESIFNFQIASPAGACGLLQIMPATGKKLAELEHIENFEPKQLYNAFLNIRLGIRYLVDLKAQYNDDYMYVLGNYNAGPTPTKRWQALGEGVPWDIRVEEISYWETRDYVKRVMGNYWIYQEIYDKL